MKNIKTLIVEDDPIWMERAVKSLDPNQFDIVLAMDLATAVAAIEAQIFDVIVLDLTLPDSNANNTLAAITNIVTNTPIVVVSSLNDEKTVLFALGLGVQDFIAKNQFSAATLLHATKLAIYRIASKLESTSQNLERFKALDEKVKEMLAKYPPVTPSE